MPRRKSDAQLEAEFQGEIVIPELRFRLPGCQILKNDSGYQQGIPDLSVFHGPHWAWLEVKAYEGAPEQPNQRHFIELADEMSFGAFIYPENKDEVLDALQRSFRATGSRSARPSRR